MQLGRVSVSVLLLILCLSLVVWGICSVKLCRVCKQQFSDAQRFGCRFHSGPWIGAELSKHHGKFGLNYRGTDYSWDCCDSKEISSPGCCVGFHKSYDEDVTILIIKKSNT
jgi:hypothetical protein